VLNVIAGDVSKKMDEYEKDRKQLAMRQDAQREKQNMSIQDKINQRKGGGGGLQPDSDKQKSSKRRSRVERRASVNPIAADFKEAPKPMASARAPEAK
jgi:hypothetical protein